MATKKQQWLDYLAELTLYREKVKAYAQALPTDVSAQDDTSGGHGDSGENPPPPLPPSPPK